MSDMKILRVWLQTAILVLSATAACAQAEQPNTRRERSTHDARSVIDNYLMKDLRYFESKFGVAEKTSRDYWARLRGHNALYYTINDCYFQVVADRGRVISIGVYVNEKCDISVDRSIFGVNKASEIAVAKLENREMWTLASRCPNTDGICARLDDFGEVIGEPADTIFLRAPTAMMIPDISLEGWFRDDDGNLSLKPHPSNSDPVVLMYRESRSL